jgi:mannose/cellobiose epimerase-like protein (N-acyl-D-glucosamine 2-epimerase family)
MARSLLAAELQPAAFRLRTWAIEQALPLWASAGFDRRHGRFEERLSLGGERISDVPLRLMVQARQIHSFGLAARRGWYLEARPLIEEAYASMVRDFHRRDGGDGWVFSIDPAGAVVDATRDLYAHAFVLLGIACYVQATGKRDALQLADATIAYIDRHLSAPRGGGYLDSSVAGDAIRRQNPHMHMFEGLIALWMASSEARYLKRAEGIFELFRTRFFLADKSILAEYFDADLRPAKGQSGEIFEPGHHYEWIWLLRSFERASAHDAQAYVDALYGHADKHGYDEMGLIVDEMLADGRVLTASHRTWPVTEAIKANVVEASYGRKAASAKAARLVGVLFNQFLKAAPPGGWIDRLNERGNPSTDFMPASTLYHILGAVDELERSVTQ